MPEMLSINKRRGESKIDSVCLDDKKTLLRVAVIEYFRWSQPIDNVVFAAIGEAGGKMPPNLVPVIARHFGIARTLNLGEDRTIKAKNHRLADQKRRHKKLAKLLNITARTWPCGFRRRAKACDELASTMKTRKLSAGDCVPASAATKFMWFLKPDQWTLFDSYVARALNPTRGVRNRDQMKTYYSELGSRRFVFHAGKIQKIIRLNDQFSTMYGTRVIDLYLWLVGNEDQSRHQAMLQAHYFLGSLPTVIREPLYDLACKISCTCAETLLKKEEG